jgi:hypothetical protein
MGVFLCGRAVVVGLAPALQVVSGFVVVGEGGVEGKAALDDTIAA